MADPRERYEITGDDVPSQEPVVITDEQPVIPSTETEEE